MPTIEDRITTLEQSLLDEQEWRREMVKEIKKAQLTLDVISGLVVLSILIQIVLFFVS